MFWIYYAEYHNKSDSQVSVIPSSAETCPTPGITAKIVWQVRIAEL